MDTEKQRQRRCNNARLTESGNARTEQLLVVPTESLTNRELLPGELLNGSECQRLGWFLDMKYKTCSLRHLLSDCFSLQVYRMQIRMQCTCNTLSDSML